uniref:Cytochrome b n=1 Tax=Ibalia leucospoides TaxID=32408 RepID=A0A0E3DQX4_9HYME|nr:cytochrome b [Ibalia leucospoides]AIK21712.1 cytochrome b [Ibalia leucospoides]
MKMYFKKNFNFMKIKKSILYLPTPININILWNFGSILGICLMIQIISGLFLSMHYTPNIYNAFNSIINIIHNINYGWIIRLIHMNGASMYFLCMFIHIGRGLYYNSYYLMITWLIGSIIFIVSMATAFLGYVLPWGQMSYWGATVITNLMSAIPMIGNEIVMWLWGGFSINNATLNRFYSLHFILPFIILMMILLHLMSLHITGSSNPLGVSSDFYKISFHSYFTIKDIQGFLFMILFLIILCYLNPYMLNDPENFNKANAMITPIHIQPEWYFLFAYAILRSIPNKLGGVIALMLSIMIIMILPLMIKFKFKNMFIFFFNQILFWTFVMIVILLTWIGMKPIEYPFMMIGQILTFMYFFYYIIMFNLYNFWENKIF